MRERFLVTKKLRSLDESIAPMLFNLDERMSGVREHQRRRRSTCDDRYLLFMLDTSGSIGKSIFDRMVNTLSQLVPLFCDNTKVAAMTFGTNIYHEFCFDCYDSNQVRTAISSIPYKSGLTHTGRAIKCACDEILTIPCGLPSRDEYRNCPAPIDVIVITDGHSNGPLNVCNEAKCLHDQSFYDVNTFTIGVKNYDQDELDCIVDQNDLNSNHIFNLEDFDELEDFLQRVITFLSTPIDPTRPYDPNNYHLCFNVNKPFGGK